MNNPLNAFKRGWKRRVWLLLGCVYVVCWVSTLYAETREKLAENEAFAIGSANIVKGNVAMARESAISLALMKGVENYLVRRLGSQGVADNFGQLVEEIIPNAREEIENFYILSENQIAGKYRVFVRLKINEKVITEKMRQTGVMLAQGPPIKVLFLVSEANGSEDSFWWKDPEAHAALSQTEVMLHNAFQKRGFRPINRALSIPNMAYPEGLRALELTDASILSWGRILSADVVIYGRTEIVGGSKIFMTLEAWDVSQGVKISQGTQVEGIDKGVEGDEKTLQALEKLVNGLVERLAPSIIRVANASQEKVLNLEITLKGLSTYKDYRTFKDFLIRDVDGVKSVRQTRLARDSMSILVQFRGEKSEFLNRVLNHENLPFQVDALETEQGDIVFRIEPGTW